MDSSHFEQPPRAEPYRVGVHHASSSRPGGGHSCYEPYILLGIVLGIFPARTKVLWLTQWLQALWSGSSNIPSTSNPGSLILILQVQRLLQSLQHSRLACLEETVISWQKKILRLFASTCQLLLIFSFKVFAGVLEGEEGPVCPNAARAAVLPCHDLLSLYSSPLPFSCQESVFRN